MQKLSCTDRSALQTTTRSHSLSSPDELKHFKTAVCSAKLDNSLHKMGWATSPRAITMSLPMGDDTGIARGRGAQPILFKLLARLALQSAVLKCFNSSGLNNKGERVVV